MGSKVFFNECLLCIDFTLSKTPRPKLGELVKYFRIFIIINNTQIFENYEVLVVFFGNNMKLLVRECTKPTLHRFKSDDV